MKKPGIIKNNKETLGIIFGVLAAFVILFSQSFYYKYLESIGTASVEQSDERSEDIPVLKMTQDAVMSVAQISIHQALDYLRDISINTASIKIKVPRKLRLDRYFQTLFNAIISPNAP